MNPSTLWSDNESEVDLLRFRHLAEVTVGVIRGEHLRPTTLGIFGDWGSGKSTLIRLIEKKLSDDKGVLYVPFNGWLFEGYEDAKASLIGTILDAIEERVKADQTLWDKLKGDMKSLRERVNWLAVVSTAGRIGLFAAGMHGYEHGGLLAAGSAMASQVKSSLHEKDKSKQLTGEDSKKLLKPATPSPDHHDELRRGIREFRKDFQKVVADAKIETLVVSIDDLDRCLPSTIIETLEAIRLFLYVPRSVFLLGADERLIEYAVRQRFPELPGSRADVGRDYLEKLVQIPIRVPPLSDSELHAYVNLLFAQQRLPADIFADVCKRIDEFKPTNIIDLSFDVGAARDIVKDDTLRATLEADLDTVSQIIGVLTPGMMGNPRRTKRFLNMLLLRLQLGEAKGLTLNRAVLAKLMVLEYLRSEFFKQLAEMQAAQQGKPTELASLENAAKTAERQVTGSVSAGKRAESKDVAVTEVGANAKQIPTQALPDKVQAWFADDWMRRWLDVTPQLSGTDLRPYFYIAHDRLGAIDTGQLRLSAAANDVLNRLLDSQQITHKLGLEGANGLNSAELSSVFDGLAANIRQAQTLDKNIAQTAVFELAGNRPEIVPQLVTLYGTLPITKITLEVPSLLYEVAKGSPSVPAAHGLLKSWIEPDEKTPLAVSAKQTLSRTW